MLRRLAKAGSSAAAATPRSALSVIGADVHIVGNIITQGEMQIDGQVDGDIRCQILVVGEGACITGAVIADSVKIHGELHGKISAGSIVIARSARVVGDITHDSLEIEAGAQIEGHISRKSGSLVTEAPLPFTKAAPAETVVAAAAAE